MELSIIKTDYPETVKKIQPTQDLSYIKVDSSDMKKTGNWVTENPGTVAVGCFAAGLFFAWLYACKADKNIHGVNIQTK
jgi:hypothetical protein